jgi:hypothetical protein
MTSLEMYELLWQDDPYNHPGWEAFKEEMKDKQYGREPLNQAWWFFRLGWEARPS